MGGISGSVRIRQGRACCGVLKNFRRFDYYGLCGQCFFSSPRNSKVLRKAIFGQFSGFFTGTFFTPTFYNFHILLFSLPLFLTGTFFVFFHGYYHTVFRTGCIFHGHKFDFFRHLPKKSTGTDIFDKTGTGDFYYTREQTREHFCSRDS